MKANFFITILLIAFSPLVFSCGSSGEDQLSSSIDLPASESSNSGMVCGTGNNFYKIMPIGDSITEGEEGHYSYRRDLWLSLASMGCKVDFVGSKKGVKDSTGRGQVSPPTSDYDLDHEGYWGYRVDQILPFISSRISTYLPDIVLVHLGTNDMFQGESIAGTIKDLETLINTIRAQKSDTKVFLAKVIPSRTASSQLSQLNVQIEILAKALSSQTSPDCRG